MSCDWEGNRRSGIALAMRHRLKRFIHVQAQGLSKGDEHPTNTKSRGEATICPFGGGDGSPSNTMCWADAYLSIMYGRPILKADPSNRLAKIDIDRNLGVAEPLSVGELGLHLTQ